MNVNLELLKEGLVWHYVYYNCDQEFAAAEASARIARKGLWATDNPTPPWDYRRQQRQLNQNGSSVPATR